MTDLYISDIIANPDANVDLDAYPFSLPVFRHLDRLRLTSPVTFFVGENGTGKSTLLEAIAVNYGFNPEGGTKNFNFATRATHSELCDHIRIGKGVKLARDGFFLRAESFYNFASEILRLDEIPCNGPPIIGSYGGVSLHAQSHGESFMALMLKRLGGNGIYIFDEPEAALSPMRQMVLLAQMHKLVRKNSQFIIATHSPMLLAYPGAAIYVLTPDGIRLTPYTETEHYVIARQFLNNPDGMMKELLSDEDDEQ